MTRRDTELSNSDDNFDVIEVSAWEAGHHDETGKIVVVFRWTDAKPYAWGCDPDLAEEIGKGLLKMAAQARKRKH